MNCLEQSRQFAFWERVIGDERRHHFGGHFEGFYGGMMMSSSRTRLVRLGLLCQHTRFVEGSEP